MVSEGGRDNASEEAGRAARVLGAHQGASPFVLLMRGVTDVYATRPNRPLDALAIGVGRVAPGDR